MRIVTGAISHETSTFTPVATTYESFLDRFGDVTGDEMIASLRNTNTPVGGFIKASEELGFELIPTIYREAHPSGPAPRAVFDRVVGELVAGIREALPVDGVLLELHGAMVAEGVLDAEGHILAAVREVVGPGVPISVQLDIHSNVSPQMIAMSDILIGRESYPETDMAERGYECAEVLMRTLRGEIRPTQALYQIPMLWGMNQITAHPPMSEAIAELHRIEALPGVICGSIATCFPLADIPDLGASVYIITDNDPDLAQQLADELGAWIYARRAEWQLPMPSAHDALAKGQADGLFPLILSDRNDNPGGGSPGDSTGVLSTFIEEDLQDACVLYIVDPEAVAECVAAGVGSTITLAVGAKSTPLQGEPVVMTAEVVALSNGEFYFAGPMYAGVKGYMGPSAYIRQGGVHVILVSNREQPFDSAFAESMGLFPRQMRYISLKSAGHFRASFGPWAGQIIVVSEPSVHSADSGNLQFVNVGRDLYPLVIS